MIYRATIKDHSEEAAGGVILKMSGIHVFELVSGPGEIPLASNEIKAPFVSAFIIEW